jgi:hypothetical protein
MVHIHYFVVGGHYFHTFRIPTNSLGPFICISREARFDSFFLGYIGEDQIRKQSCDPAPAFGGVGLIEIEFCGSIIECTVH